MTKKPKIPFNERSLPVRAGAGLALTAAATLLYAVAEKPILNTISNTRDRTADVLVHQPDSRIDNSQKGEVRGDKEYSSGEAHYRKLVSQTLNPGDCLELHKDWDWEGEHYASCFDYGAGTNTVNPDVVQQVSTWQDYMSEARKAARTFPDFLDAARRWRNAIQSGNAHRIARARQEALDNLNFLSVANRLGSAGDRSQRRHDKHALAVYLFVINRADGTNGDDFRWSFSG